MLFLLPASHPPTTSPRPPSSTIGICRLDPPSPTSSVGASRTILLLRCSTPVVPTPRRTNSQSSPPYSHSASALPRGPRDYPNIADVATAAAKLRGPDQRRWFAWSHPSTTHGWQRPPAAGRPAPRLPSSDSTRVGSSSPEKAPNGPFISKILPVRTVSFISCNQKLLHRSEDRRHQMDALQAWMEFSQKVVVYI